MKVKARAHHYVAAGIIGGLAVLAANAWNAANTQSAMATCSSGAGVNIMSPAPNVTVAGSFNLVSSVSSTTQPSGVTYAISAPSSSVLGNATPQNTGSGIKWVLPWDSKSLPNGSYQLIAIAHYGSSSVTDCASMSVPFFIHNQSTQLSPRLTVNVTPSSLALGIGQATVLTANGTYTDQNGTEHPVTSASGATFHWVASGGGLGPNGQRTTTLTAGVQPGNFSVGLTITMNGVSKHLSVPLTVTSPSQSNNGTSISPPSQSPASGGTLSSVQQPDGSILQLTPDEVKSLIATASVFRPPSATNANPVVPVPTLACLKRKLGPKYAAISSGQIQPTVAERRLSARCFSGPDRIPAQLAPVEPGRIGQVPQNKAIVSLTSIKNKTVANTQGVQRTVIFLSGTATPDSDVFLYVFSDPMVLRAQADKQGKWSYVLENPLKPGEHEVYAVATKDANSFVRTSAVPIAIAAAGPESRDGSLVLESRLQPIQTAFIIAVAAMVGMAIFLILRLRKRRKLFVPSQPTILSVPSINTASAKPGSSEVPPRDPKN